MTQRSFSERLQSGEILVADGATGTNYQDAGLEIGVPPEEWVFDAPLRAAPLSLTPARQSPRPSNFGGST